MSLAVTEYHQSDITRSALRELLHLIALQNITKKKQLEVIGDNITDRDE